MPELTNSLNIGMLWRNESDFSQEDHIRMAADYFMKKFGVMPDLVHIPITPHDIECGDMINYHGQIIQITRDQIIQPGHLWIGLKSEDVFRI